MISRTIGAAVLVAAVAQLRVEAADNAKPEPKKVPERFEQFQRLPPEERAGWYLKELALTCTNYSIRTQKLPERLEQLIGKDLSKEELDHLTTDPVSGKRAEYFGGGRNLNDLTDPGKDPIVAYPPDSKGRRMAAYSDGSVRHHDEKDFQAELKRSLENSKKNGGKPFEKGSSKSEKK